MLGTTIRLIDIYHILRTKPHDLAILAIDIPIEKTRPFRCERRND
jgi:hypothetical protein